MADTQYKGVTLVGKSAPYPAIGGLAPNTPCRWEPFGALQRAQDAVLSGRRVVAEWSISGSRAWAQPAGTVSPISAAPNIYPEHDVWRMLGRYRVSVTPGHELRARVLYAPAGLTQKVGGAAYISGGVFAALRIGHVWAESPSGSTTAIAYRSISMEGSEEGTYKGGELAGAGAWWGGLRVKDISEIRPANFLTAPATAVDYSEWPGCELQLQVKGGARVLHVVVYEHPLSHVQEHSNASLKSAHAAAPGSSPQTMLPQTKPPNGTTYNENRFGVTQTMQVAERQSERLGPRLLHASSWRETDANIWDQTEGNPWTTSSATNVEIQGSGATSWSPTGRGWICSGPYAKLHRLCDPKMVMRGGVAAVLPVRVWVDASQSAGTGTLRVQSGPYEWVEVPITGARDWYSAVGYLQSQVFGDQNLANVQAFFRCTAGTLSVYNFCVDFGQWALQI